MIAWMLRGRTLVVLTLTPVLIGLWAPSQAAFAVSTNDVPAKSYVTAPVDRVYTPQGFDDDDQALLVISGSFPDTCYALDAVTSVVDKATMTVTINAQATRAGGDSAECALVLTHFSADVRLGTLQAGTYRVVVDGRPDAQTTSLVIAAAQADALDAPLYAPVERVTAAPDDNGRQILTVVGTFPYTFVGCMLLTEVVVNEAPGNVIDVLPLAMLTERDEGCEGQRDTKKFAVQAPLPDSLAPGEYLVHVHSANDHTIDSLIVINP